MSFSTAPAGVWVIVVAAGAGQRFGGLKQFAPLAGRPVVARSLDAARAVADGVVLVAPEGNIDEARTAAPKADLVVAGGATRSASVRAGLAAVPADAGVIVVHDGARPLASAALFRAVVDAVEAGADAALPALAMTDTLKRVVGDAVVETVDRAGIVTVQTPQAFRADVLRVAHAGEPDATDDAGLVEAAGGVVRVVPGDPRNMKITSNADVIAAEALLLSADPRVDTRAER